MKVFFVIFLQSLYCYILYIVYISYITSYIIYCVEAESEPGSCRWFEIIFHKEMFLVIFVQLLSCCILYIVYISYIILRPKTILVSAVGWRSYFMKVFCCYIFELIILL